jgi:hypothetical protein
VKSTSYKLSATLLFLFFWNLSFSQTYIPGNTYYDSTGFVEYRAGNLPIIISTPHGGSLEPASIPDRNCAGCVYLKDSWTKPIAEGIYDSFYQQNGCYPHMIINLLHRKKFDANRDIGDAADGNFTVEQAWNGYHDFIESAKAQVVIDYGRGLFLDIHGHAHTIQRIELGYLLSASELQLSDSILNMPISVAKSSIRTLTSDNIQGLNHSELLRGQNSFGTLLDDKGFPSVPSFTDPFPDISEAYFSGGYNIVRHGSRDNEGEIDAIQLELNQDVRFNTPTRELLIDSITTSAIEYFDFHYNNQFVDNFCNLILGTSEVNHKQSYFSLFPNPASDYFILNSHLDYLDIKIYNAIGQMVLYKKALFKEKINIDKLEGGVYIVQLFKEGTILSSKKLIIK